MDCSLRFYYKYLANIKQLTPYSENIGKPEFGKITHNALELVYNDVLSNKQENVIEKNDFLKIKAGISGSITKVIKKHFLRKLDSLLLNIQELLTMMKLKQRYYNSLLGIVQVIQPNSEILAILA